MIHKAACGYARFLAPGTSTLSTELLRLHSPRVSDQQCPVVCNEGLLQLQCAGGVVVLGVVCDDSLGDGLSDSVHLGNVSTTLDANPDVNGGEFVFADDEDGLVDLIAEDLRPDEVDGGAVNTDETAALASVGDSGGGLSDLQKVSMGRVPTRFKRDRSNLLFTECLNCVNRHFEGDSRAPGCDIGGESGN